MLEATIQKLQEKLKDSRLKEVLVDEVADMLATKPSDVRAEEYITAAAVLIVRELKNELLKDDHHGPDAPPRQAAASDIDCETIINGLLVGMHHDLLESNLQMVKALGSAIAERDHGTREHNFRVTIYSIKLAEHMKLDKGQIQALVKGSFLHDIGKIGIRDKTLLKPSGLTDREYDDIKKHAALGRQIIENVRWLGDAADIILYHHEKWDGTGYPEGRAGVDIPLKARIFSIADVFDALTSERPYKSALPYSETVTTMLAEKAVRFDPELLGEFLSISQSLYNEIVCQDIETLEDNVLQIINTYFQFSPAIDDLRNAFGSIAKPGSNSEE
jgi:HD-GYP domain-containing protein (c-di-GMP phosphodiesterase class II)